MPIGSKMEFSNCIQILDGFGGVFRDMAKATNSVPLKLLLYRLLKHIIEDLPELAKDVKDTDYRGHFIRLNLEMKK